LILKVAAYHDIECRFQLYGVTRIDDAEEASLNRRRAHFEIDLSIPMVREINTMPLEMVQVPIIVTELELDEVGLDVSAV
jgi:hypothetical protein